MVPMRWSDDDLRLIDAAAVWRGVKRSEFIRAATMAAVDATRNVASSSPTPDQHREMVAVPPVPEHPRSVTVNRRAFSGPIPKAKTAGRKEKER